MLDGGPCQVGIRKHHRSIARGVFVPLCARRHHASRSSRFAAWRRCPKKTCPIITLRASGTLEAHSRPGCEGA